MLHPVTADKLYQHWEWVKQGLQKTLDKLGDDWKPEDVYAELKAGQSALYLIYAGHDLVGFVVLQLWPTYHAGPRLFVRALWAEPRSLVKHKDQLMYEIKELARSKGAVAVRMNSPRRWDAAGIGFSIKQYIYEAEV